MAPVNLSVFWRTPVFSLDARLAQDSHVIGDFELCRLLLSNDARYPWFILVPRRAHITEVFQLDEADREMLWTETNALARSMHQCFNADKINIATLGNVVSQLHMHVIVRYQTDACWPAPVWGKLPAIAYTAEQLSRIRSKLAGVLGAGFVFAEGLV
jgi:diadenosine tetraphosphate (Ap4A) HIT family hydrolase